MLQPIVRLNARAGERRFLGFEVLGRIRTDNGLLSAGLFIDQLIEMNLIDKFDSLMLEAICAKAEMIKSFADTLFVNVSPASLNNDRYVAELTDAMRGPLAGLNVVIELTEQTLLEKPDLVRRLAKEKGLVFAIDDFGTGYSSLMSVIELATDGVIRYLKVDGSLTKTIVEREATGYVFEIISEMAESLHLYSIAEFIENDAISSALAERNITYGQGFHLGRPHPPEYWLVECADHDC